MEVILKRGNTAMKAYMYNVENGLYAGETFEESAMLVYEDGITTVPPPDYENGQVPVFNRGRQAWEMLPVTIVRRLLSSKQTENLQLGFTERQGECAGGESENYI